MATDIIIVIVGVTRKSCEAGKIMGKKHILSDIPLLPSIRNTMLVDIKHPLFVLFDSNQRLTSWQHYKQLAGTDTYGYCSDVGALYR